MRLFIAADLPPEVRQAVWLAMEPLRDRFPRIRWVPPENLHVTLKFLGQTRDDQRALVEEVLTRVARAREPFELTLEGIGGFPSGTRAKTIWVGLDDAAGSLPALAGELDEALAGEFEPEGRAYHPHLTVARASRPVPLLKDPPPVDLPAGPFGVGRLALYRSHLSPDGPTYARMASVQLLGEDA